MAVVKDTHGRQRQLLEEANRLYEQYGKPFEAEHWGEFIAISRDGRTLLGTSSRDLTRAAKEALGPGNFIFKIGPRVVGKWR